MTNRIPETEFNYKKEKKKNSSRNSQTVELTRPHFNAAPGSTVTLRYKNTHRHPSNENNSSPYLKSPLITSYRCRAVFLARTISRSRSASSSAVINARLSSLPCCAPGLLAFGTPLGAALGLCFGSTRADVTVGRCAFTWPSVSTCSESSSSGSTPRAQQGSLATRSLLGFLVSYLKRLFVRRHWACCKT